MSQQFGPPERFRDELRDAPLEHAATLRRRDPLPAAGPLAVGRTAGSRIGGRRLLVVLVLAAVVAAAILALRAALSPPQSATAASVLRASAGALDRLGGSRALGPDDYLYTRTAEWWLYVGYGPHPYMVRSIQEAWLARDGRGRSRYDVVGLSGVDANRSLPFARSSDARLPRHARPFIISTLPSPGILLSYAQLRRLPTDPTRLEDALNRLAASYRVNRLFPAAGLPRGDPVGDSPWAGRGADVGGASCGAVSRARGDAGDPPARSDTRQHRAVRHGGRGRSPRHPTRDDHRSVDRPAAANEPHDPPPKPPVPRRGARTELPRDISREWNRHIHERTHTLI